MHVLIVNFKLKGIDEQQYAQLCDTVAPAFAAVPGLLSKVWLKDSEAGTYGGVYFWQDRDAFERYRTSDLFKSVAANPNLIEVTARDFAVLDAPTRVTNGALTAVGS
jgi:heme-degrading monooxygenase HmoA